MNKGLIQSERAKAKQAKSEQMDRRKLSVLFGRRIEDQEGQPVATCDGAVGRNATARGLKAEKETAAEIVRRWNAFPELVAALRNTETK